MIKIQIDNSQLVELENALLKSKKNLNSILKEEVSKIASDLRSKLRENFSDDTALPQSYPFRVRNGKIVDFKPPKFPPRLPLPRKRTGITAEGFVKTSTFISGYSVYSYVVNPTKSAKDLEFGNVYKDVYVPVDDDSYIQSLHKDWTTPPKYRFQRKLIRIGKMYVEHIGKGVFKPKFLYRDTFELKPFGFVSIGVMEFKSNELKYNIENMKNRITNYLINGYMR